MGKRQLCMISGKSEMLQMLTLSNACLLNFFIISSKSKSSLGTVTGGALGGALPLPRPAFGPPGPPLPGWGLPAGPLLPSFEVDPPAACRKLLGRAAGFAMAAAAAAAHHKGNSPRNSAKL